MRSRVLPLLLALGCASVGTRQPLPSPDDRARALLVIQREFLDIRLPNPVGVATIAWSDGSKVALDADETEVRGASRNTPDLQDCVDFISLNGGKISDSPLVHELMHCSLGLESGDSDHSHNRPEWRYVDRINERLAASGL